MKEIEELELKRDSLILNRKREENIEGRKQELEKEIENTSREYEEGRMILKIKSKYEEEIQKEKLVFDAEKKAKEETKKKT